MNQQHSRVHYLHWTPRVTCLNPRSANRISLAITQEEHKPTLMLLEPSVHKEGSCQVYTPDPWLKQSQRHTGFSVEKLIAGW